MRRVVQAEAPKTLRALLPEILQTGMDAIDQEYGLRVAEIQLPPVLYQGLFTELLDRKVYTQAGDFRGRKVRLNPYEKDVACMLGSDGMVLGTFTFGISREEA